MNNPWTDLFNHWIETYVAPLGEDEMKPYEVRFTTRATVSVFVDAYNEDEAIELAIDNINLNNVNYDDWEVDEVDYDYDER